MTPSHDVVRVRHSLTLGCRIRKKENIHSNVGQKYQMSSTYILRHMIVYSSCRVAAALVWVGARMAGQNENISE